MCTWELRARNRCREARVHIAAAWAAAAVSTPQKPGLNFTGRGPDVCRTECPTSIPVPAWSRRAGDRAGGRPAGCSYRHEGESFTAVPTRSHALANGPQNALRSRTVLQRSRWAWLPDSHAKRRPWPDLQRALYFFPWRPLEIAEERSTHSVDHAEVASAEVGTGAESVCKPHERIPEGRGLHSGRSGIFGIQAGLATRVQQRPAALDAGLHQSDAVREKPACGVVRQVTSPLGDGIRNPRARSSYRPKNEVDWK